MAVTLRDNLNASPQIPVLTPLMLRALDKTFVAVRPCLLQRNDFGWSPSHIQHLEIHASVALPDNLNARNHLRVLTPLMFNAAERTSVAVRLHSLDRIDFGWSPFHFSIWVELLP